jgi:predicted peptidase
VFDALPSQRGDRGETRRGKQGGFLFSAFSASLGVPGGEILYMETTPMRRHLLMTAIVALALPALARAAEGDVMLDKKVYKDADGKVLKYRLLLPPDYDSKTKYPLVLFLHGAGERGDDNTKQLVHGVAEFTKADNRKKYPCFLVAPQCPEGKKWCEVDWGADRHDMPKEPSEPLRLAFELLEQLQKDYSIDAKRIYITGLSMGGYGTWDAICRKPDYFAAAVPICGGCDEKQAEKIAKVPIWAFHGAKDTAVKPARSKNMIEALKKAGGDPKYTEYENVGHDSWVRAYQDAEMFAWMFGQKRK